MSTAAVRTECKDEVPPGGAKTSSEAISANGKPLGFGAAEQKMNAEDNGGERRESKRTHDIWVRNAVKESLGWEETKWKPASER